MFVPNDPGGDPPAGDPAPLAYTLDELKAAQDKAVAAVTARKNARIEQLEAQQTARVAELEAELEGHRTKSTQAKADQWQAERDKYEKRTSVLQQQVEAEKAARVADTARWHASERDRHLQAWAVEAGCAPTAVADIPSVLPADRVEISEDESGRLQVQLVDPATGVALDPVEAMRTWLQEEKPHLCGPPKGGAGLRGAGPAPPRKHDPLAGVPVGAQQIKKAFDLKQ